MPGDAAAWKVDVDAARRTVEQLEPCADPAVVFAALTRALVPSLCDTAAATVVPLRNDPDIDVTGLTVDVMPVRSQPDEWGWFTATVVVIAGPSSPGIHDAYTAAAGFRWRAAPPSAELALLLELVCRHAATVVLRSRLTAAVDRHITGTENLRRALDTNRIIGAAIGVLMATRRLTYDQAHRLLSTTSQDSNRKMAALASDVLHAGTLPS